MLRVSKMFFVAGGIKLSTIYMYLRVRNIRFPNYALEQGRGEVRDLFSSSGDDGFVRSWNITHIYNPKERKIGISTSKTSRPSSEN